ncbi:hypothetical protein K488DRAFT_71336 [Vararia minispora EC-137]|uniref:Uncharacterized protein n=1 Tax=Vararia minispora EC-137 TaxID=1314806 RepID=A0ACB8QIN7_9AGAM|nr:hypothetical protein K488DRAFT_71336 [Vararia minispora EC-137]
MFAESGQASTYLTALIGVDVSSIRPHKVGNQMRVSYTQGMSQDGQSDWILDYFPDLSLGPVIRQRLYVPTGSSETVARHVTNAQLRKPIFFVLRNGSLGVQLNHASAGETSEVVGERERADFFGGLTTTNFCINWVGHSEFRKQVELHDSYHHPITVSRLLQRIGRRVDDFLNDADAYFDRNDPHWLHDTLKEWRAHPGLRPSIYIIGLLHVSRGVWEPILQLRGVFNLPGPPPLGL